MRPGLGPPSAPAPGSDQAQAIRRSGTADPTLAESAVWAGEAGVWPLPMRADVRHDQVDVQCDVGHFPAASPATCGIPMRGRRGHRVARPAAWTDQATQEASIMMRELATCPAVTCPKTAPVVEAARIMAEANIGFVVVVDLADVPVGVVTDRDIVVRAVAAGHHHATVAD